MKLLSFRTDCAETGRLADHDLVRKANERLRNHLLFCCRMNTIQVGSDDGRLVVTGKLPSFYLKQVLQTALRELPGVVGVINRVDVVSPRGVSSVRWTPWAQGEYDE
jgi:hypothetical protein